MFLKNVFRIILIAVAVLAIGFFFKRLDTSPDDYISSAAAEKYRIMNYFELGKSVGRTSLLEYMNKYENDSLRIDLSLLQAIEDSIQQVQMKERFGQSIYE